MAGVYFHIPFCKQACHYCDFHFSTSLKYKQEMLQAIAHELKLQADFLPTNQINTVYFGGGTPSLLTAKEIDFLIHELAQYYNITSDAEITLEANPDDLDKEKISSLTHTDINRLSIGVQSFYDEDLRWMNRAHCAQEAETAIKRAQDTGFENITADLIYGFPMLTDEKWANNVNKLAHFQIPHISAYNLTVEPRTALAHFIAKGKQATPDEEQGARQFTWLIERLVEEGYQHYEISNFAKPNRYAIHNTNYWQAIPYLGLGPSAHSYNGLNRQWNVNHNTKYIRAIMENTLPAEVETLSITDRLNEYIMTSLRTMWGLSLSYVQSTFGFTIYQNLLKQVRPFIAKQYIQETEEHLILTTQGKLMADHIAATLFADKEEIYEED